MARGGSQETEKGRKGSNEWDRNCLYYLTVIFTFIAADPTHSQRLEAAAE